MASKSRRQRRKEAAKTERSKGAITQSQAAAPALQEAVPTPKTAPTLDPTPVRRTMARPAAPAAAITYPHVAGELKKIGITAVIMLAVLGILSRVIS